jgi:MFS transporter, OFA family, oxalate/formate antiporter
MVFPPEGWMPEGWTPPVATKKSSEGTINFSSSEMLRTPQYYLILATFTFSAAAGLMSIGLMRLWPQEALTAAGVSPEAAGAAATLAMAVFFALFNGFGRIVWGMISDKIGRKRSIIIMMATQGLFVILFQWMAGNIYTLYLFAILIGFNFGGTLHCFPPLLPILSELNMLDKTMAGFFWLTLLVESLAR